MTKRTRVIAEAGVNHNGNLDRALRMIDAAKAAGADAVKFQTFKADRIVTRSAPKADYQMGTTDPAETQWTMLQRLELSEADHHALAAHCRALGIDFLSTPFDEMSADFLVSLGVTEIKIASGEITNFPLLIHIARLGLPVILSTGMSDLDEVSAAVSVLREAGAPALSLLQCTTEYPADPAEANLLAMLTMAQEFGVPVGLSDHTPGIAVALGAAALGAAIIEKHFTLDRALPGPDHQASLEPSELAELVAGIRTVDSALGDGQKRPTPVELRNRAVARKSLVAARDLAAGTVLAAEDLIIRRPGTGLPPGHRERVIGRRIGVSLAAGSVLTAEMLGADDGC